MPRSGELRIRKKVFLGSCSKTCVWLCLTQAKRLFQGNVSPLLEGVGDTEASKRSRWPKSEFGVWFFPRGLNDCYMPIRHSNDYLRISLASKVTRISLWPFSCFYLLKFEAFLPLKWGIECDLFRYGGIWTFEGRFNKCFLRALGTSDLKSYVSVWPLNFTYDEHFMYDIMTWNGWQAIWWKLYRCWVGRGLVIR